jgi:hypothetical protein
MGDRPQTLWASDYGVTLNETHVAVLDSVRSYEGYRLLEIFGGVRIFQLAKVYQMFVAS